ncbi:hypothetical protein [Amycolatopsis sp. cmx-4-68]|uniref:hypothetical protein n=1 Tax=Amycolatopsis sp. cmx-4-68 TaxID=2790938 RepID=UPI00397D8EA9
MVRVPALEKVVAICMTGIVMGVLVALRQQRRVVTLTDRYIDVMAVLRDDSYDEGRMIGMAEAFDVIAEHRQPSR